MADYQVGNLQIAFEAIDKTSADFKELSKNLRALQKLITNIGNADITPFVNNIKALRKEMSPLLTKIQGASQGIAEFNAVTKELGVKNISKATMQLEKLAQAADGSSSSVEHIGNAIDGINNDTKQLANTTNKVANGFNNLTTVSTPLWERNKTALDKLSISIRNLISRLSNLQTEEQNTQNEENKTEKSTRKSTKGFNKLFNSLKRIAFYRLIRTVLKEITQSLQEGVKAFAQVDDKVNDTMSKLTSSLSVIKLSFTATLIPLLEIITPIIQQIGLALANVANMVSQAMSTTGIYTKINTDLIKNYREELEKTGSLAAFDKIQALNTPSGGLSDFLIPNEQVDESDEKLNKIRETFDKLRIIMTSVYNIVQKVGKIAFDTLLDTLNAVLEVITPIIEGLSNFITKLDEMGLLKPIIESITYALLAMGAVKVINGIKNVASAISTLNFQTLVFYAAIGFLIYAIANFVNSFDEISSAAKVLIPVISLLVGVFAALAVAKAAAAAGIAAPAMALVTAGAIAAAITMIAGTALAKNFNSSSSSSGGGGGFRARAYADGGSVPYGTLFYAGEAGAETVTVGSSGRTEVTNVSQMETALYNALVRYGRENSGRGDNAINVNIDGQRVFEAVQRTANKKGLGFSRI